jgi:hypothetical protein
MMEFYERFRLALGALASAVAAFLPGCATPPVPPAEQTVSPAPAPAAAASTPVTGVRSSAAASPRAYRQDAATHVYGLNQERIFKGRLPPMLYAIGVLQVDLDSKGAVRSLNWMRKPTHAPEVTAEIERTVRAAAPYPAPVRMGRVTWTDTWLWHKSGRFQLDTLTEGQD